MTDDTTEPAVEPATEPPVDPDAAVLEPADDGTDLEPDDQAAELDGQAAEPDAAGDEPSTQALLAGLDKEYSRHQKAIAKLLDVELDAMHECETCEGIGFTPEPITAPPPLVQDPYTETCPRCAGNGETLSGATSRGLYAIPCNGCGGSGYVTKQEQPDAGAGLGNAGNGLPAYVPPTIANPHEASEVAALRARGYTILEPITVPPQVPA